MKIHKLEIANMTTDEKLAANKTLTIDGKHYTDLGIEELWVAYEEALNMILIKKIVREIENDQRS